MPWNSTWPSGIVSVRANKTPGQQNTTYLETTLKNDHFFNQDASKDGYHKKASMPNFGSVPGVPAGSDGVYFVLTNGANKEARYTTDGTTSWRLNIWKVQLKGTFTSDVFDTNFTIVSGIPANAVGEIFIFRRNAVPFVVQSGQFASDNVAAPNNTVHAFSNVLVLNGNTRREPILLNNNPTTKNVIRGLATHTDYAGIEFEYIINYTVL